MKKRNFEFRKSIFRSGTRAGKAYNILLHLHPRSVDAKQLKFTTTFCMGGLTFLMFLVTIVSGVFLMFFYVPEVEHAYRNMKDLEYVIFLGRFMRNIHRWSAHAMVVFVVLHMVRVFYQKVYRPPREFNWVVGVACLILTFALSFTGYLLPWDQLSYWAITVGTNMLSYMPLIGAKGPLTAVSGDSDVRYFILGGATVGQNALLRFYVLHVLALPLILLGLIMFHFWRVRKDNQVKGPL